MNSRSLGPAGAGAGQARGAGIFSTPRPVPSRLYPALLGGSVVALALPVFLLAGWRLSGWGLGAVLWAASQALALVTSRLGARMGKLAGSGVLAFGMMFRAVAVMVVLIALVVSDPRLAVAAALVYGLAYTAELAASLLAYFVSPTR